MHSEVLEEFCDSVVLTNKQLKDNQLFEVMLEESVFMWDGSRSAEIGFTTHTPETLEFPTTMTDITCGTWVISGKRLVHNKTSGIEDLGCNLDHMLVNSIA